MRKAARCSLAIFCVVLLIISSPGVISRTVIGARLAAVTNLQASSASYTSIKLTWSSVSGADHYQIYRAASSGSSFTRISTLTSDSRTYTDTGLVTGQTYYYKVRAYVVSGSTRIYGAFSAVDPAYPRPSKPGSVYVMRWGYTRIRVGWNKVSGATSYEIARSTASAGPYTVIDTTTGTTWLNTGLQSGQVYYYKVRALHLEGSTNVKGALCSAVTITKPSTLSNSALDWWYTRPTPTYEDVPATISASVSSLIARYNVTWHQPASDRKVIYLTMDEGYEYGSNTTRILDIAREKNVRITFFVTGSYLKNNPAKVQRMQDEGHTVANHTDSHTRIEKDLSSGGAAELMSEIRAVNNAYEALTGAAMVKWVRPPEGGYSERALAYLNYYGYRVIFWSFAYRDWVTDDQPDPDEAIDLILGELHNGSILLLHAASNTNVAILPDLIDNIRARGYEIVPLS